MSSVIHGQRVVLPAENRRDVRAGVYLEDGRVPPYDAYDKKPVARLAETYSASRKKLTAES